jgi:CRISPR-associated endonuclease Cas3-HD
MLSNSKGHDLIQHLKATAIVAKAMANRLGLSDDLVNDVYIAGLLHDIGKAVPSFQSYMKICNDPSTALIVDDDYEDSITGYPLHHEIGWAYLTQKMGIKNILNAIYWHHARPIHIVNKKKSTYDNADDILVVLDSNDIKFLDGILVSLQSLIQGISWTPLCGTVEVPNLFDIDGGSHSRNDNAKFMLIRACVISADRFISSLNSSSDIELLLTDPSVIEKKLDNMVVGDIQGIPVKPSSYDQKRYDLQVGVVSAVTDRTAIIKAPAGLGKTLIGILWAKSQGKRTVWVCPRNVVADAVYENIVREIDALGLYCSVELYRTGKLQKTNVINSRLEFCSDIIVTNIDAVMSPMVNNSVAGRLFLIFGANIVLDEFHEFVSDAPLFATFVTYMRARHRVSNVCKTLLLSATPSLINVLWDVTDNKTQILPDAQSHYAPAHSGTYQIDFSVTAPGAARPGSLLVSNSVSQSQENYSLGYTHVIHHRYTENDRKNKEAAIYNSFGKDKEGVKKGESLSAALVVQAAMDISFKELYDSVCSPESTLQRIGRTDRWGTFQSLGPKVTFVCPDLRSEQSAIATVYNCGLQDRWFKFLKQELAGVSTIDLEGLYKLYNKFYFDPCNNINYNAVRDFLIDQYSVGMNGPKKGREFLGLVGFEPLKVLDCDPTNKSKISNKNLRSPNGSYFYTVGLVGQPNVWLSPNDVLNEGNELYERYSGNGALNLGLLTSGAMLTRLKGLVACGYNGWMKQVKGKSGIPSSIKDWFKKARNPETPLPDFSRQYDSILGVKK